MDRLPPWQANFPVQPLHSDPVACSYENTTIYDEEMQQGWE